MLLRKFTQLQRVNSQLDYQYIGSFKIKKMIGTNAVELDIARDYPILHPVFNLSLIVWYVGKNSNMDCVTNEGIKEKYYQDIEVVDWKLISSVLDAQLLQNGKYEFLLSWKDVTLANDTGIAEDHFPEAMKVI